MPIIKQQQQIEDVTHMCEKITITDNMNFINEFRYMPMKQKIILLEQCIAENKTAILEHLEALYVEIDGVTYHTLLYKDVENSYTSTHPVPKKLLGKTRMFKNGQWQPIQSIQEERDICIQYKSHFNAVIIRKEKEHKIYGIISILDGDMRIRLREMENREKAPFDNRYIRRGRSLKSIRKTDLLYILKKINGDVDNLSITEIVERIDSNLIKLNSVLMV